MRKHGKPIHTALHSTTGPALPVCEKGSLIGSGSGGCQLIPHEPKSRKPRTVVDRDVLRLIKMWLKTPVEERDEKENRRMTGGRQNSSSLPRPTIFFNELKQVSMDPIQRRRLSVLACPLFLPVKSTGILLGSNAREDMIKACQRKLDQYDLIFFWRNLSGRNKITSEFFYLSSFPTRLI
jgi:hypothetical protein